ncbi:MAG: copper resistance protein CopC [Gammaproteobacteria bacterium]|nr:copper resistance protein CopC [Gammaproteobacteria bacterium]
MNKVLNFLVVTAIFMMAATSVSAHPLFQRVSPEAGEVFTVSPEYFAIQYSKTVRLVKLNLLDQLNNKIDLPDTLLRNESKQHLISLPTLPVGAYRLTWILMGSDGHKMTGKTHFSITEK